MVASFQDFNILRRRNFNATNHPVLFDKQGYIVVYGHLRHSVSYSLAGVVLWWNAFHQYSFHMVQNHDDQQAKAQWEFRERSDGRSELATGTNLRPDIRAGAVAGYLQAT